MKNMFQSFLKVVVLAVAGSLANPAAAQVYPTTCYGLTNFPATLAPVSLSVTTNIVPLTKNCGLALQGVFNVSAGTSNVLVQGSFSADGTNYATTPWTWTIPAQGTTRVVASTNWSSAQLAGYVSLNITTLTNQNSGTLTNAGFLVNRVAYGAAY
jgi:hypothetical protein